MSSAWPKCPCKPSSVPQTGHPVWGHGHSSRTPVARGLQRPYPRGSGGPPFSREGNPSYSVLLRVGFAEHPRSPGGLVSSYLTVSPLPRPKARRSVLCGTFLPVTGTPRYGAPCPVELGLSSRPAISGTGDHAGHFSHAPELSKTIGALWLQEAASSYEPEWTPSMASLARRSASLLCCLGT